VSDYVVYRPSVMRSGRLGVRAAAVAALAVAALVAFVVVTHTGGQRARRSPAADGAKAGAPPSRVTKAHTTTAAAATGTTAKAATTKAATATRTTKPVHRVKKKRAVIPAPAHTPVAVLNGWTATGAAAVLAGRLRSLGYPVPVVGNAGRRDLPMSIEYAAGLGPAARALARHLGPVRYVTPFDGPARNLSGARLLVIVGS
jgi:LytR cell envelope-related transcriptional attenuator